MPSYTTQLETELGTGERELPPELEEQKSIEEIVQSIDEICEDIKMWNSKTIAILQSIKNSL